MKKVQKPFLLNRLLMAGLLCASLYSQAEVLTTFTQEQANAAVWSVAPADFENSLPKSGSSYFDYVFSKLEDGHRVYDIPYPFPKVIERIENYLGYTDGQSKATATLLFPMGRSLQRNAAFIGEKNASDKIDLFFRFPRIVIGVINEPKNIQSLDLRGRLFLGFNEKTKVIEVISYNDSEGRFEYQIVKNHQARQKPEDSDLKPSVVYARRQVCLSCHQNQTPIFSLGNWHETNIHPEIQNRLTNAMQNGVGGTATGYAYGAHACDEVNAPP